jgi:hypothetical protein
MFYYWIVDSNTRNPQNIVQYNIKYMDNSVRFFLKHGGELHIFIIRKYEKKREGGSGAPHTHTHTHTQTLQQTHTVTKVCAKVPSMTEFLIEVKDKST